MRKFSIIAIFSICIFACTSCASIFCGSKATVVFESDIEEPATMTIDGQKHKNVDFPYTTKIRRGFDETIVKVEAPSYETEIFTIYKRFNPVSIINLTDILGWGIDAATGAITKPEYKVYEIEMTPKKKETKTKE